MLERNVNDYHALNGYWRRNGEAPSTLGTELRLFQAAFVRTSSAHHRGFKLSFARTLGLLQSRVSAPGELFARAEGERSW